MIVVFSGYNQRAVLAFLRTLNRNSIEYKIIASGKEDSIFYTCYEKNIIYVRKNKLIDNEELFPVLQSLYKNNEKIFLAPSTEFLNRWMLDNRKELEQNGCVVPLVNKKKYELVSDKRSFYTLCQKYKIKVPRDVDKNTFKGKVVAKPKTYVTSDGKIHSPHFIFDENDYKEFCGSYDKEDFDFQEYFDDGCSIYLLFYFSKSGEAFFYSQKNLAQQDGGKSILAALSSEFHKDEKTVAGYLQLFKAIGFRGLVMVEIRRINGIDFMIEANPRFWGPSQLFCDAGYNLFEEMLFDYDLIHKKPNLETKKNVMYLWSDGNETDLFDNEAIQWYENGKEVLEKRYSEFKDYDIYNRADSEKIYKIERLNRLYMKTSKHSNYQKLAIDVSKIINQENLTIQSRQEEERFKYILKNVNIKGKRILDIGCNTGFFSFESLKHGAEHVDCYEGNKSHAEFVEIASSLTENYEKLRVINVYFSFDEQPEEYDLIFNLNVVHHLGDDFGDVDSIINAKQAILECINNMSYKTKYMILQFGFNWKGDRDKCLFDKGTKQEMIDFIRKGTNKYWTIESIGVAECNQKEEIVYDDVNEYNIKRDDSLGEFLNRPIFVMKSLKK